METVVGATKSKTVWFGLALTILGALQTFDFTQLLNEQTAGIVVSVIGGVVVILRGLTTKSLAEK